MIYFRAFVEELRIGLEESWNYRTNFISELVTMLILYLSLLFMDSGTSLAESYTISDVGSKELLLAGYMLWSFSIMSINIMSDTISCESSTGTLEHKYMSIIPIFVLNLAIFAQAFITESLIVSIILIVSKLFFNISINFNLYSILIILITSLGMYGIGMILGGLALKVKKIGKVVFILQVLFLFIGDTITNISNTIQISKILPLTLGNELLRDSIALGSIDLKKLLILIICSLIWIIIGIIVFKLFEKNCKKEGGLGYY